MLLGDREFWAPGLRVTLLIRAPIARERDAAVHDVCQMTEAQFRQHWIAQGVSRRHGERAEDRVLGRDGASIR